MGFRLRSCVTGLTLLLALGAGAAEGPKTTLTIKGMTCGGCVAAVKAQLRRTAGVSGYEVSLEKGEAEVAYDPAQTDPHKIAESVSKTGLQTTVKDATKKGGGPTSDGWRHESPRPRPALRHCSREPPARLARRS